MLSETSNNTLVTPLLEQFQKFYNPRTMHNVWIVGDANNEDELYLLAVLLGKLPARLVPIPVKISSDKAGTQSRTMNTVPVKMVGSNVGRLVTYVPTVVLTEWTTIRSVFESIGLDVDYVLKVIKFVETYMGEVKDHTSDMVIDHIVSSNWYMKKTKSKAYPNLKIEVSYEDKQTNKGYRALTVYDKDTGDKVVIDHDWLGPWWDELMVEHYESDRRIMLAQELEATKNRSVSFDAIVYGQKT